MRRLMRDYEQRLDVSQDMIHVAMGSLLLRKPRDEPGKPSPVRPDHRATNSRWTSSSILPDVVIGRHTAVTKRLAAMGIRDHPTAARSPWQNGHAERLIGSIRRECLDHIVVFGDAHLRQILAAYTGYYNELRTHLSLDKDSPGHRPIQRIGQVAAQPILGGLHHHYCRM
jgi:hypothetical protein